MKRLLLAVLAVLAASLSACTAAPATQGSELFTVYASSAAAPWLSEAFTCAQAQGTVLSVTPSPTGADLALRLGEPSALITPAYQVDSEEILVVTNRQSPVQNLDLAGVRDLFAGRGDESVQVWVYDSGEDVQQAFDRLVMQGGIITSLANMAVSPQHMSDTLNAEANAVGILPRHWKAGDVREVYSAGSVPVLAITRAEPTGRLKALIACLQASP
jgi:hypothetical protein